MRPPPCKVVRSPATAAAPCYKEYCTRFAVDDFEAGPSDDDEELDGGSSGSGSDGSGSEQEPGSDDVAAEEDDDDFGSGKPS